ncbi:MAG: glycosyltransferase family 2 protein [Firmicutes bacterium]|nr:glycosyltransferase family 2 protein [Bacillota bacterium]
MKLLILLSTWNGARYLPEQLTSILSQEYNCQLSVLIRDDGSQDDTRQIIEQMNDGRVEVLWGENLGAKGSYLALLAEAYRRKPDLIAFADQDDLWLPGKLLRAADALSTVNGPALYCSALNLVDEALRPIGTYSFSDLPSYEGSFFNNCATGCTCVFNRALLDLLAVLPEADAIVMHDWWLYIVAAAFGQVFYDQAPMILYRQHASNQIGMQIGVGALFSRIRRLLRPPAKSSRLTQAREFDRIYYNRLTAGQAAYVAALIKCEGHFMARLKFAFTRRPKRTRLGDEIAALFAFMLGR